jgi:pilus assembly protein Flp/PilA
MESPKERANRLNKSQDSSVHPVAGLKPEKGHIMRALFARFLSDECGATAIEYGLIAAGISVAIITVVAAVGSGLNTTFTSVQTALK